jgi:hypothetical protein
MGDVSAWLVMGLVIATGMTVYSGVGILGKYRALLMKCGQQEAELKDLRDRNVAGENWRHTMPLAFEDAKQVIVVSDREPTDQDMIDTDVPVIWLSVEHQRSWSALPQPHVGQWNENTFRDTEGYNHFFAITAADQFIYVHTSEHAGLSRLVRAMTGEVGSRIDDPVLLRIARETPDVVNRLMDSAGGTNCKTWSETMNNTQQGYISARRLPVRPSTRQINLD